MDKTVEDIRKQLQDLYKEYERQINEAHLYTHESILGFYTWLLTGEL